jgi:hypothetical protein
MTIGPPPRPMFGFKYWLGQVKQKLGMGLGQKSALDMMTPEQVSRLTPEAKKYLARVPGYEGSIPGAQAAFQTIGTPLGIVPKSIYGGQMVVNPTINLGLKTYNSTPTIQGAAVLHEGIHGVGFQEGGLSKQKEWLDALSQLSPESRAELIRRSNWGGGGNTGTTQEYSGSGLSYNGHIINPDEAMAYAGMYGYENVPKELKAYFAKHILKPAAGPPQPNPAQAARLEFDRTRTEYKSPPIGGAPRKKDWV